MADTAEQSNSSMDTVKLGLAVAILVGGFWAYMHFDEQALLYRVLGLLVFVVIAAGVALTTEKGRSLMSFMKSARTEVRKMVWPTRTETIQTTAVVLVMVIIVAIFLWLLDMFLGWIMKMIIG
jgi:preprotein translocase subunit SecE